MTQGISTHGPRSTQIPRICVGWVELRYPKVNVVILGLSFWNEDRYEIFCHPIRFILVSKWQKKRNC